MHSVAREIRVASWRMKRIIVASDEPASISFVFLFLYFRLGG